MIEARTPEAIAADRRVMYVIVRTDLKMGAGKVAAAVGHAVQMLMRWYLPEAHHRIEESMLSRPEENVLLDEVTMWIDEDYPSYAKIILGADEREFVKVQIENDGFLVTDRGFSEVEPGTKTAFGLYPMKKSEARGIIRTLKPYR